MTTQLSPDPPARPRRARRLLRSASTALIVVGLLLIADAVLTVVWQEPGSAVYATVEQRRLDGELRALRTAALPPVERRALRRIADPRRRLAFAARSLDRRTRDGRPVGRLRMPAIGVSTVVVAGTAPDDLRKGPGHYPDTPLPGVRGTVGIAGHRTTYGAPFRKVDRLRRGDRITVEMPYGQFVYVVERTRIVAPTATWVTDRVAYDRLILSACHPLYSAAKRIVVFARLTSSRVRASAMDGRTKSLFRVRASAMDGRTKSLFGVRASAMDGRTRPPRTKPISVRFSQTG